MDHEQQSQDMVIRITAAIFFLFVFMCIIALTKTIFFPRSSSEETDAAQEEASESTEEEKSEEEVEVSEDASENNGFADDESEEEEESSGYYTKDIDDSEVIADEQPDTDTAEKTIGELTITYDPSCAQSGSGYASDFDLDIIYFHDGDVNNVMACLMGGDAWDKIVDDTEELTSVSEAQELVSEDIAAGTTASVEWEETENWFIRKTACYDDDTAYIWYVMIAKSKKVSNWLYIAGYAMVESSESNQYSGVMTDEDSFYAIQNALCSLAPDSELLAVGYDEMNDMLQEILWNETASSTGVMSGISDLKANNEAYLKQKYGVDSIYDLDGLTEEELEELEEENRLYY